MIKDFEIRKKFILKNKKFLKSGIFINEYSILNRNIADISFYNGDFYCYEIKSEADNLKRLTNQLKSYLRIFDYVYVVCFENHIEELKILLNKYNLKKVGIIKVNKKLEFSDLKPALKVDENFKVSYLFRNIDRNLLVDICKFKNIRINEITTKNQLINKLCGKLKVKEIKKYLYKTLLNKYNNVCAKCKSNLIYNTSGYKNYIKKVKNYKNKKTYTINEYLKTEKTKFTKCFECGHEFNIEVLNRKLKFIKTYEETIDY